VLRTVLKEKHQVFLGAHKKIDSQNTSNKPQHNRAIDHNKRVFGRFINRFKYTSVATESAIVEATPKERFLEHNGFDESQASAHYSK
jgi:hypothetical protein